jgi:hypothetical protein
MFITATEAKIQDDRQAQGQAERSARRVQGQAERSARRVQGQDRQGSKTRRARKSEAVKRQELTGQTLVSLTNKTNWQQTNRKHKYKYKGDNGEERRHLERGGNNHKDR